jgi:peptidoglycan/LPS O-acetylase OafA/YrhL
MEQISRGILSRFSRRMIASEPGGGQTAASGRLAELDSVRGLAALGVLVFHANQAWLPCGWASVDLFFVLSGYLITSIVLREGGSPGFLRSFYIRRGLRIWPIYYLMFALLIIASPLIHRPLNWFGLIFDLTYTPGLHNLWGVSALPFTVHVYHTWTLAIEEQFYLVWPAFVLLVGPRRLPLLAVACAAVSVAARCQYGWSQSLIAQADGLALGGLLAAHVVARTVSREVRLAPGSDFFSVAIRIGALAGLVFLVLVARPIGLGTAGALAVYPGLTVLAFNLLWLGVVAVTVDNVGKRSVQFLRFRPLQRLGQISYGLYLYHYPMLVLFTDVAHKMGRSGKLYDVRLLAILLTFPIAMLSWRFIEQPLLELKRRYSYRPVHPGDGNIRHDRAESNRPMGERHSPVENETGQLTRADRV